MGILDKLFNREPKPGAPRPVGDDDFEPEVLASEMPSVVQFYSNTCPHCHVMTGLLKELGSEFAGRLNVFTMNINYNPNTARSYQIRSVPTVLLFRNGRPRDSIIGLLPLQPLKERLQALIDENPHREKPN